MTEFISAASLIMSIVAVVFTYLQIRNHIRPQVKIKAIYSDGNNNIVEIELRRLPQCYRLTSVRIIGTPTRKILDYGFGEFEQRIPQLQYNQKIQLNYCINADFSEHPASVFMWFRIEKTDNHHLELRFINVLAPYFTGYQIPIIQNHRDLI